MDLYCRGFVWAESASAWRAEMKKFGNVAKHMQITSMQIGDRLIFYEAWALVANAILPRRNCHVISLPEECGSNPQLTRN